MSRRAWISIAVFAALLASAGVLRMLVGGPAMAWPDDPFVVELRGLRLCAGLTVGAALGLAGVLLQSLLRNPLASPDLMGLAAGAGLAVTIATYIAYRAGGGLVIWSGAGPAALIGSLLALTIVYVLSQRSWLIDPVAMILVGVVVSFVFGAVTVFVQHLMPDRGESGRRWMMGMLSDETRWADVAALGVLCIGFAAASAKLGPAMDAASMSEDEARSSGVPLGLLRAFQFAGAGVLTAGSVAIAGPIGFVGLICPHVARLVGGPAHRGLSISAALAAAALVVGADTLVKSVTVAGGRLPIGVLTSVIGGPVFIWLLLRERASMRA